MKLFFIKIKNCRNAWLLAPKVPTTLISLIISAWLVSIKSQTADPLMPTSIVLKKKLALRTSKEYM